LFAPFIVGVVVIEMDMLKEIEDIKIRPEKVEERFEECGEHEEREGGIRGSIVRRTWSTVNIERDL
jgi:hypothetical protein